MEYTRNSDPSYYEHNCGETNCGSFALRLKEWYDAENTLIDEVEDPFEWALDLAEEGYSEYEIANLYLDITLEQIKKDFGDDIIMCNGEKPTTNNIELIAYAASCMYDLDDEWADCDFHFKVFRNNHWQQKNGSGPVNSCELNDWGKYNSDVIYFYHKIGEENECD